MATRSTAQSSHDPPPADLLPDGADRLPGGAAHWPSQIPWRGYRQVARRVWSEVGKDNLSLVAAGIAFFGLLGIFPGLTILVSVYSLLSDRQDLQQQLVLLRGVLPPEALEIVSEQMRGLAGSPASGLGLGGLISVLLLVWSASNGTQTLLTAINLAYDEEEDRSYLRLRGLALALTLGALTFFLISVAGIAVLPTLLAVVGLDSSVQTILRVLRWPLLGAVSLVALGLLYRIAPNRRAPKWRWITWGSVVATGLWLTGSGLFSLYVQKFGRYGETYGALGAVVVLLLWFYLSAFVALLGAEINAEMEHQTGRDSTIGPDRPMGERQAWVADHIPE